MSLQVKRIILLLIVFFTSSQVGIHFWPPFSFISGVRVDYLSPTLYLLDILIIAIFLFSLPKFQTLAAFVRTTRFPKVLLFFFVASLIWNLFYSKSASAHVFGIVKLIEFIFLGFYISWQFKKQYVGSFVKILSLSAVISSVLAIWQFLNQGSIGGIWYYFGERTFNISTIGISTVNLGSEILRPYAAFPHPNVLAFFLFTTIVFTVLRFPYGKTLPVKVLFVVSIMLSTVGLFLTFSRVSIILSICFWMYIIYTKLKSSLFQFYFLLILLGIPFIVISRGVVTTEFLIRGIDLRQELLGQSFSILANNLYFGIGLNNFFVHQTELIKEISPIVYQPPHNIFVLAILSLGIFGWWVFPTLFIFATRSVIQKLRSAKGAPQDFYKGVLIVLISIIVVGMFDHFFLTLEQGQLILALILGLSFAKLK